MDNFKIKPLTKEQLIISVDRLTRFKNTEIKYLRVFIDVIVNNLISPKFKKAELEMMDYSVLKYWAEMVINYSIEELGLFIDKDYTINEKLAEYEKSIFNCGENVEVLLNNKIAYNALLSLIDEDSPKNLRWLKLLLLDDNIFHLRQNLSLRFPVSKVVIVEGATEETLLPEFAKFCGYDLDQHGVYILSAGGKNQVVKMYYNMVETLKLPMFVLLDKDAMDNLEEIKPRLRNIDRIHILECGEFEDLLPMELIKRTLDYEISNISLIEQDMFNAPEPRVKILEDIFKTRGMHEFKKVEFAQMIKNNIKSLDDLSPEIANIIEEIKTL